MKFDEIKELINLCSEKGIAELEVEMKGVRVHVLGHHKPAAVRQIAMTSALPGAAPSSDLEAPAAVASSPAAAKSEAAEKDAAPAPRPANIKEILSPMVGTFYRAPSPDAPPFADVGKMVSNDTVVCIIEAMKLMNEIKAETSGKIVKVLVENGQPVEFNQPLFEVEA